MKTLIKIFPIAIGAGLLVSACGYTTEERAVTGAIAGAAVGQAVGGDTKSTVTGAAIGGVAGAATTPR